MSEKGAVHVSTTYNTCTSNIISLNCKCICNAPKNNKVRKWHWKTRWLIGPGWHLHRAANHIPDHQHKVNFSTLIITFIISSNFLTWDNLLLSLSSYSSLVFRDGFCEPHISKIQKSNQYASSSLVLSFPRSPSMPLKMLQEKNLPMLYAYSQCKSSQSFLQVFVIQICIPHLQSVIRGNNNFKDTYMWKKMGCCYTENKLWSN